MEKLTTKKQVRDFVLGNPDYDFDTRNLNVCSIYDNSYSFRPRPGVYLELFYYESGGTINKMNRLLERAGFPSVDKLKKMFPQFSENVGSFGSTGYLLSLWVGSKPIKSLQTIPDTILISVPRWWEVAKNDYHDFGEIKATLNEIGIRANFEEVGQTGFNYRALFWIGRKPNLVISKLTEKYKKTS